MDCMIWRGMFGNGAGNWYGDYSATYPTDPRGLTSGSLRIRRGGSWASNAFEARCANRFYEDLRLSPEQPDPGFRCVRGR